MCAAGAAILLSQSSGTNVPVMNGNTKVDQLLSQMRLTEKISLIHGSPEDASLPGRAGVRRCENGKQELHCDAPAGGSGS